MTSCHERVNDCRGGETERPTGTKVVTKFTFEEHDYISFSYSNGDPTGIVHDPECRKCKKKVEE